MKIDINKKYQTRDGREEWIYAVDGGGTFKVHGAILTEEGWQECSWRLHNGKSNWMESENDLSEKLINKEAK